MFVFIIESATVVGRLLARQIMLANVSYLATISIYMLFSYKRHIIMSSEY